MNGASLSLIVTFSPPRQYGTCHMNNNFIYYTEKSLCMEAAEKEIFDLILLYPYHIGGTQLATVW